MKKFNSLNYQALEIEEPFAHHKNFLNQSLPLTLK